MLVAERIVYPRKWLSSWLPFRGTELDSAMNGVTHGRGSLAPLIALMVLCGLVMEFSCLCLKH